MAKKLINRLERNASPGSSVSSQDLLDYSVGAFLTDEENRTLWVNGMPYGNAYISFIENGENEIVNTRQPKHAEIFNDFNHNKAEGHYSHAEGGAYVNTVYNNAKITKLETPVNGYKYSVPYTSVLNKMIQVMAKQEMNIPLYVVINNEGRLDTTIETYVDNDNRFNGEVDDMPNEMAIDSTEFENTPEAEYNKLTETKYFIVGSNADTTENLIYFNVATSFTSEPTNLPAYCDGKTMYFHYYYAYDGKDGWTEATKDGAHAEGISQAHGVMSHTEGFANRSYEDYSHTEGVGNEVYGLAAHAEGDRNIVTNSAPYSHAEGHMNIAKADSVHVEGRNNLGNNTGAHVEGGRNVVNGIYGHAEGYRNTVNNDYGHAEGFNTNANGDYSHTEGYGTITENSAEHAEGMYNVSEFGYISSIGIGSGEVERKNAVTVLKDGRIYLTKVIDNLNTVNKEYDICNYDGKNLENADSLQKVIGETILKIENITYSSLRDLLENNALTAGKFYKITDFATSIDTRVTDVRSDGKQFDLIVLATSTNTISENVWSVPKDEQSLQTTYKIIRDITVLPETYIDDEVVADTSSLFLDNNQEIYRIISLNNINDIEVLCTNLNHLPNAIKVDGSYKITKTINSGILTSYIELVHVEKLIIQNGTNVAMYENDNFNNYIIVLHSPELDEVESGKLYAYVYDYCNFNYIANGSNTDIFTDVYVGDLFNINRFVRGYITKNTDAKGYYTELTITIDTTSVGTTTFINLPCTDIINGVPTLISTNYLTDLQHKYMYSNISAWKLKYSIFNDNTLQNDNFIESYLTYKDLDLDNANTLSFFAPDKNFSIQNYKDVFPFYGFVDEEYKDLNYRFNYTNPFIFESTSDTKAQCILSSSKSPVSIIDPNYKAILCKQDSAKIINKITTDNEININDQNFNNSSITEYAESIVNFRGDNDTEDFILKCVNLSNSYTTTGNINSYILPAISSVQNASYIVNNEDEQSDATTFARVQPGNNVTSNQVLLKYEVSLKDDIFIGSSTLPGYIPTTGGDGGTGGGTGGNNGESGDEGGGDKYIGGNVVVESNSLTVVNNKDTIPFFTLPSDVVSSTGTTEITNDIRRDLADNWNSTDYYVKIDEFKVDYKNNYIINLCKANYKDYEPELTGIYIGDNGLEKVYCDLNGVNYAFFRDDLIDVESFLQTHNVPVTELESFYPETVTAPNNYENFRVFRLLYVNDTANDDENLDITNTWSIVHDVFGSKYEAISSVINDNNYLNHAFASNMFIVAYTGNLDEVVVNEQTNLENFKYCLCFDGVGVQPTILGLGSLGVNSFANYELGDQASYKNICYANVLCEASITYNMAIYTGFSKSVVVFNRGDVMQDNKEFTIQSDKNSESYRCENCSVTRDFYENNIKLFFNGDNYAYYANKDVKNYAIICNPFADVYIEDGEGNSDINYETTVKYLRQIFGYYYDCNKDAVGISRIIVDSANGVKATNENTEELPEFINPSSLTRQVPIYKYNYIEKIRNIGNDDHYASTLIEYIVKKYFCKGHIYEMTDEFGNTANYDMSNIMFKIPNYDKNAFFFTYYAQLGQNLLYYVNNKDNITVKNNVIKSIRKIPRIAINTYVALEDTSGILTAAIECSNNIFNNCEEVHLHSRDKVTNTIFNNCSSFISYANFKDVTAEMNIHNSVINNVTKTMNEKKAQLYNAYISDIRKPDLVDANPIISAENFRVFGNASGMSDNYNGSDGNVIKGNTKYTFTLDGNQTGSGTFTAGTKGSYSKSISRTVTYGNNDSPITIKTTTSTTPTISSESASGILCKNKKLDLGYLYGSSECEIHTKSSQTNAPWVKNNISAFTITYTFDTPGSTDATYVQDVKANSIKSNFWSEDRASFVHCDFSIHLGLDLYEICTFDTQFIKLGDKQIGKYVDENYVVALKSINISNITYTISGDTDNSTRSCHGIVKASYLQYALENPFDLSGNFNKIEFSSMYKNTTDSLSAKTSDKTAFIQFVQSNNTTPIFVFDTAGLTIKTTSSQKCVFNQRGAEKLIS